MVEDPINTKLGAQIRAVRLRSGLTQAEVAERAGVAFETVSRIERGTLNTTVRTLVGIAGALGVSPGSLLDEEAPTPSVYSASLTAVLDPLVGESEAVCATAARLVAALVAR